MGRLILAAHLPSIRAIVAPLDTPERRERYRRGDFPRSDAVKDLDKRYRWDLWYAAGVNSVAYYAYLCEQELAFTSDSQLDSALRAVVPPLEG